MIPVAQNAYGLAAHLVGIADRTITDQTARYRIVVLFLCDWRSMVDHAAGQNHGAGCYIALIGSNPKSIRHGRHAPNGPLRESSTIGLGATPHPLQKLRPRYAIRKRRDVVGSRNQRRATGTRIYHFYITQKPRQVDCRRQTGWPAADDHAVLTPSILHIALSICA